MKEAFINQTVSLCKSEGVVHIETLGYSDSECMIIEWDARSLLEDIPLLYSLAKKAVELEEESNLDKFVRFKKQLANDWKGQRGRKAK